MTDGQCGLSLRPYQVEAVEANLDALNQGLRGLTVMPTGTGKTVVAVEVIRRRGGRSLTLVHRDELIWQTVDKLVLAGFSELEIGVVKAARDQVTAPHVVASVQTLARESRRERVGRDFCTLWIDESHHAAAPSYLAIMDDLAVFGADGPATFGTTATPDRLDKLGLEHIFDQIVYEASLLPMMRAGYLCDIKAKRIVLPADLDAVRSRGGDFVESDLATALEAIGAPSLIAGAYLDHARERRGIIFVPSVVLAHATAAKLRERGVAAEALDGSTPDDLRRAMLGRLKSGETRLIANCGVLTEGFDEPSIDTIIMARPTQSRPLYQQCIGRALRPYPGKEIALILDLVGNSDRHALITTPSLLGLDPRLVEQAGAIEANDQAEATRRAREDGLLRAPRGSVEDIDILGRREFHWTEVGTTHVLSAGDDGWLGVEQAADGTWRVLRQPAYKAPLVVVFETRDQGYALGKAEDLARAAVSRVLRDRGARWRADPMSPEQHAFFERWKLPVDSSWTKGEAADRQTATIARWSWLRGQRP
ncbi:MAG: DEAD/DEAH box helicase [Chloroflexi bacterium]|nr:DEAD/DEAH box helicase [Chloroflexota bacterium]MBV9599813.1 DEAD/DEAH box helicase [Chloroflexota bacterium]